MRRILFITIFLTSQLGMAQENESHDIEQRKFYFYWGWNRSWYSRSNIQFKGEKYDFILNKVKATDRQSSFGLDPYFNPSRITIPQYNFRIGYQFNDHWDFSIGVDHMKYILAKDQILEITGNINTGKSIYDGNYENDNIALKSDFLQFEHTDGLNTTNIEIRRIGQILEWEKLTVDAIGGFGLSALIPRTNTRLLGNERYDEFHLAGYALSPVGALRISFFDKFFIQPEYKAGFIHMPDVRTTQSKQDRASQSFFYSQFNVVFGGIIRLNKKSNRHTPD